MNTDPESTSQSVELEVVGSNALEAITRGEIDIQIKTAKAYPRSIAVFKKSAIEMAIIDEETAESTLYRRPVGKKPGGETEYAEGMSVRMAEIVTACYGNIRVGSMIVEFGERRVVARGFCHDLERNVASQSEVVEATITRSGAPMSERMRVVIAKAALAKARRDATFQVVPKALCRPIETAVRQLLTGGENAPKTMERRRANVMRWLTSLNIDLKRVWTALSVGGEADLTADHLETLGGIRNAIKENDTTVDEAFPVPQPIVKDGQVGANPVTAAATGTKPAATKPQDPPKDNPPGAADPAPAGTQKPAASSSPTPPQSGKKPTLSEARKAVEGRLTAAQVAPDKLVRVLHAKSIVDDATLPFRSLNSDQLIAVLDTWDDLLPDLQAAE